MLLEAEKLKSSKGCASSSSNLSALAGIGCAAIAAEWSLATGLIVILLAEVSLVVAASSAEIADAYLGVARRRAYRVVE